MIIGTFSNFGSQPTVVCEISLVDPKKKARKTKRREEGRKEGRKEGKNNGKHCRVSLVL